MESVGTPVLWMGFSVFVLGMLALDLGVFHHDAHELTLSPGARLDGGLGLLGT
jgi:hypothetical protein